MASSFMESHIKCPYYRFFDANKIRCEGTFFNSVNITTFKNKEEMQAVLKNLCCYQYELCPVYQAAKRKYDREE